MEDHSQKNYYEILEIPTTASADEVHQGYLRAKNAYSQDSLALYSLMSADECRNVLDLIDEAYTIISDPIKRKQYDQARGFNQNLSDNQRQQATTNSRVTEDEEAHSIRQTATSTNKNNMAKIVAQKKFGLDYNKDENFENEIEQSSNFSGEFLKKIREYKNVDILRMSEMTKVSKTYLINIELDAFDKLPAAVYIRGFVYQYAKCLKLNPELVAASYLKLMSEKKSE